MVRWMEKKIPGMWSGFLTRKRYIDEEVVEAIKLLAETEGILTETAGGVTLAVTKKLIEQGRIPRDESVVVSITGNGLKTQEAIIGCLRERPVIEAKLEKFDTVLSQLA